MIFNVINSILSVCRIVNVRTEFDCFYYVLTRNYFPDFPKLPLSVKVLTKTAVDKLNVSVVSFNL